jgi:hypothetical protein
LGAFGLIAFDFFGLPRLVAEFAVTREGKGLLFFPQPPKAINGRA